MGPMSSRFGYGRKSESVMLRSFSFSRVRWPGLALVLFVVLGGCSTEGITVQDVPYHKQRLLGAIVLTDSNSWFFKLMGDADDVAADRDAFMSFVGSLRFHVEDKEPVIWSLPEGWKYEAGTGMRYGTIYIPRGQVVTVTRLSAGGGGILPNVNRWRDQMKLPPIDGEELGKQCQRVLLAGGETALVLDVESARGAPDVALLESNPKPAAKPLQYETPEGWKEVPDSAKMAMIRFRVEDNGQKADITLTPLGGPAGGLIMNVNRWRQQLGLDSAGEEQIKKETQSIEVAGAKCDYVDLLGPAGTNQQRMLVVICPHGGQTWFIKMVGPHDLVAKQQPAFEAFVRSLRFGGGF
jgi:hypothetical protein